MRAKIRTRQKFDPTLLFAQSIIAVARAYVRMVALFGDPRKQEIARKYLAESDEIDREKDTVLSLIDQGKTVEGLEAMRTLQYRHGKPEQDQEYDEMISRLRALKEESSALKKIREETAGDLAARIARFRTYLQDHPESAMAYGALGATLRSNGDLDASLEAYRTSQHLHEARGDKDPMPRFHVYDVLKEKGQVTEAIAGFWGLLAEPRSAVHDTVAPLIWLHLGDALQAAGDNEAARSAWKEAAQRDDSQKRLVKAEATKRLNPAAHK